MSRRRIRRPKGYTWDLRAPALQNIPLRTELGKELRKAFMEKPLPPLDFASLETRIAKCMGLKPGEPISAEVLFPGFISRRPRS